MKANRYILSGILAASLVAGETLAATALGVREPTPPGGTSAQVPVTFASDAAAVALQADVLFDEDLYTVSDAVGGTQPEGVQVQSRLLEPGRLRVIVFHRSSGALGSDVVFMVPLEAVSGKVADDPVVITNILVAGQGGGTLTSTLLPKVRLGGLRGTMNGRRGIEFSAQASATDGTISKVEYYVGGVKVGEGSGPGFTFLWMPDANGPFEVTAVAYDSNGQQSSSRSFPVIVTHVGTYAGTVLGSYFGLVRGPQFSFANDGYVTMTSTTTGSYTLKLLIGGKTWSASGKFDANGNATAKIVRGKGIKDLTIVLAHSSTPPVDQIHGRVADGTFADGKFTGHTFETEFTVDRVVWKLKTREAPQHGSYTMLMPAHDDAATQKAPLGTSFGTVTIGKDGSAKLVGTLADGSPGFTTSSFLSKDGLWPLYASLYANTGVLLGTLAFADLEDISDFDGPLTWFKPANSKAAAFKDAFLTEVDGLGSRFTKPALNTRLFPLANLGGNSLLHLTQGGLLTDLARLTTLSAANKAVIPLQDADAAALTPVPTTGLLSGAFLHPQLQKSVKFSGVVFQKQDLAAGFFPGGPLGGDMRFAANPALPPVAGDAGPIGTNPLPVVKITSPAVNSTLKSVTGGIVQVKGTASDKQGIASVQVQVLHNGVLSPAAAATGTLNWTFDVPIAANDGGLYTLLVKAVDSSPAADESEVLTHSFWTPFKSALTVAVNDPAKGSVSTGYLGTTQRDVGKLLTLTATPKPKKKFLGWTGSLVSSSPKITVLMKPGTTLTANFGD